MSRFTGIRRIWTSTASCAPSTIAYTAKDQIGTKLTFKNAVQNEVGAAKIISAKLVDTAQQLKRTKLLLFNEALSAPSATDTDDNAALIIVDADLDKFVGHIDFSSGTYTSLVDNAVAFVNGIDMGFELPTGSSLYGILQTLGTGVYASGQTLSVYLDISEI